ncbi:MAG: hypothetical protein H7199_08670 [Burkholderiales bacterium]|nr:hypothetical protein [Flavobacterium sp.]
MHQFNSPNEVSFKNYTIIKHSHSFIECTNYTSNRIFKNKIAMQYEVINNTSTSISMFNNPQL